MTKGREMHALWTSAEAAQPAAQSSATTSLTVAIVGLAGVVFGAIAAGLVRFFGDRAARRADAQRVAIHELQQAALDLRAVYRTWRKEGPRPPQKVVTRLNEAQSTMDVMTERIDDAALRLLIADWRQLTRPAGLGDEESQPAAERQAWRALNREVGKWLRRVDEPLLRRRQK